MANSVEEIQKAKKTYLLVFGALLVCTCLTVAVAEFEFLDFGKHGFDMMDALLGLAIASFKATLVAAIFMHLNHEKKGVYWIFGSALFFAVTLYGLTHPAEHDPIFDRFFSKGSAPKVVETEEPAAASAEAAELAPATE